MDFKPDLTQIVNNHEDKAMFSDDTGIAFTKNEDLLPKLETYDNITTQNHLLVNWAKVFIPLIRETKELAILSGNPHHHTIT